MSENKQQQPADVPRKKDDSTKKKKDIKTIISIVIAAQIVLAILLGLFLFRRAYENGKTNKTESIRKGAYDFVYGVTENAYHVSNRAILTVENVREIADLEVLQVESNYLYVSDEEDKMNKQTIWYNIPGTGAFTVDLKMAEFYIDSDRNQVHVVAPPPSITKFSERYDDIEPLFYNSDRNLFEGNGSIKEGSDIMQKMVMKARTQMLKDLNTNLAYFQAAKESAERIITRMIKALNPSIPDINVTVEFKDIAAI